MGGYRVQGRAAADAKVIVDDARRLQDAGCFAIVLEGIPSELAARVTEAVAIPTIGIGAGPHCSGQVLVFHDIVGLLKGPKPKFVRSYVNGFDVLQGALSQWADDVRNGTFPSEAESYTAPKEPASVTKLKPAGDKAAS
jgi:3-methyl-2-oxobutanoate hydroxymethyltransferase